VLVELPHAELQHGVAATLPPKQTATKPRDQKEGDMISASPSDSCVSVPTFALGFVLALILFERY